MIPRVSVTVLSLNLDPDRCPGLFYSPVLYIPHIFSNRGGQIC